MILFLDENMPPKVAAALQALGECEAIHLLDQFQRGTHDTEWLPVVASRGWVLLTLDRGITTKPHERRVYVDAGVGGFFIVGKKQRSSVEMMQFILSRLDEIRRLDERAKRPYLFAIPPKGKIYRMT